MIVKVQVPLATNTAPQALVYNEDRTVELFIPISNGLKAIMRGRPKVYFYAEVRKKLLHINEEAPRQEW